MEDSRPSTRWIRESLLSGLVIPAHPLALTSSRRLDESRQRALTRYYHAAGAGGLAVGVHTTQFAIRDSAHGLLKPVLELASHTVATEDLTSGRKTVLIAGLCGPTRQAVDEAILARNLNYHAGLLSLAALRSASDGELLGHCLRVSEEIPIIGFYLQSAVGGRALSLDFWRRFSEIPNVVAIKIAPFNRYQTIDVIRAVAESGRSEEIALYTGNDDSIVSDLLTDYVVPTDKGAVTLHVRGGLLGHWACWTRRAVELLQTCVEAREKGTVQAELITRGAQITDANAALFDAANGFRGCIAGIHEILRRQGLLQGIWCLDPTEGLSPGQQEALDRVCRVYPWMNDDAFVLENRDAWLR